MDIDLLKYKIKKAGLSLDEFCEKIGISKPVFYGRCAGRTDFTLSEIKKIMKVLGLQTPMQIFFADNVTE